MSVAVISIGGFYCFVDSSMRRAEVESMKVREMQRAAFRDKLQKLVDMAHSGDMESARKVVDMLERNEMAESDVNGLSKIYMMLVNEGDARSMFMLGRACHRGTCGVKKSNFNAHWFLSMAKKYGYESAELDELLKKTSSEDADGKSQSEGVDSLFEDLSTESVTNDVKQGSGS
jgi:TPR repeat protein